MKSKENISLKDEFGCPPFSIIDSRQGYMMKRKRAWTPNIPNRGKSRETCLGASYGRLAQKAGFNNTGVSLLCPAMCELLIYWFCPQKGKIINPFGGGIEMGYVAVALERDFLGIELRQDQVKANNEGMESVGYSEFGKWVCDDARNTAQHLPQGYQADMVWSCPPYYKVEDYGDNPLCANNQTTHEDYMEVLLSGLKPSTDTLKIGCYCVIMIGDSRDKQGYYYGTTAKLTIALQAYRLRLYNDIKYIEPSVTHHLRARKLFNASKKLVKTHQDILVFRKIKH